MTILIWHNLNNQIVQYETYTELENKILIVSNLLIKTSGNPDNWETFDLPQDKDKIISLGLAKRENVLSKMKILKFLDLGYNDSKVLLGLPRYGFCIEIINKTGNIISLDGKEIRCDLPVHTTDIHSINRTALLEDDNSKEIVFFNIALWR